MENKFLAIDANSLIHRAYHALPSFQSDTGEPTGALYGLASMLIKIIKDINPQYAVAAFDRKEPTFRHQEYPLYKKNRPTINQDLLVQLQSAKEIFKAFSIPCLDHPGFEADDILGTVTRHAEKESIIDKIIILSGDLDVLQLVKGTRIVAYIPQKGISIFTEYNVSEVKNKFGVNPNQIPDYKGLVGDKSDNISGVVGIGPKTAIDLINKYGSLEDIYTLSPEPKTIALKNLMSSREIALLSKRLATIYCSVPINVFLINNFKIIKPSTESIVEFLLSKGFRNLAERVSRS